MTGPLRERDVEAVLTSVPPRAPGAENPRDALTPLRDSSEPTHAGEDVLLAAEAACARGEYAAAAADLKSVLITLSDAAQRQRALGLLTRALANAGGLREALDTSEQWIAQDKLDPVAHYVHALVLQELG